MPDYVVKHVEDPAAWPGNGPPWLFEGSTPEEIAAMQQAATDAAAAANAAVPETLAGIDRSDPKTSEVISDGITPGASTNQPHRGDVILFPLTVVSGPNEQGQYDLTIFDEWLDKSLRITTTLPNDAQIIDHVPVSEDISDGA